MFRLSYNPNTEISNTDWPWIMMDLPFPVLLRHMGVTAAVPILFTSVIKIHNWPMSMEKLGHKV